MIAEGGGMGGPPFMDGIMPGMQEMLMGAMMANPMGKVSPLAHSYFGKQQS
jgi:hypothetical protein